MLEYTFPWPPACLLPNARRKNHWSVTARVAKSYAHSCGWIVKAAPRPSLPETGPIQIELIFHPPDRRKRDDDGMEGSVKELRDMIAELWGVDDNRFRVTRRVRDKVTGGAVIWRLLDGAE